jgi:hypothetical protein
MQARVFRFVDHAHPATAKFLNDAVVGDGLVDHSKTLDPEHSTGTPKF